MVRAALGTCATVPTGKVTISSIIAWKACSSPEDSWFDRVAAAATAARAESPAKVGNGFCDVTFSDDAEADGFRPERRRTALERPSLRGVLELNCGCTGEEGPPPGICKLVPEASSSSEKFPLVSGALDEFTREMSRAETTKAGFINKPEQRSLGPTDRRQV